MFCSNYEALESALTKRGFIVHSVKDAEEARQLAFSLIKKEKRHHHRMPLLSYYNNESIFIIIVFIFVLIFVSKDIRIIKQSNLGYLIFHNVRSISFFLCFRSKLRR